MQIDDIPLDANGPAYQRQELRVGPPLEYVAEKLRRSVECQQRVLASAPTSDAMAAFHYALVAYLALNNMLAAADPPSFSNRLAQMTPDDFSHWLDAIDRGGSVLGLAI